MKGLLVIGGPLVGLTGACHTILKILHATLMAGDEVGHSSHL